MNRLIDVGHPAHVHFFRPLFLRWRANGDAVSVTCRDIPTVKRLLNAFGIPYTVVSRPRQGTGGMMLELLEHTRNLSHILRDSGTAETYSIGGTFTVIASYLKGVPSLVFTDTDTARMGNRIMSPFANRIITPRCFSDDFGGKHERYDGLHEVAYLNRDVFTPDPAVLNKYGFKKDNYVLVRYISWGAAHDQKVTPATNDERQRVLRIIEEQGWSACLVHEAEGFIAPEDYHSLLYYARCCVTEGGSTALEAGVLGVPSCYMNPLRPRVIEAMASQLKIHLCDMGDITGSVQSFLSGPGPKGACLHGLINPHSLEGLA